MARRVFTASLLPGDRTAGADFERADIVFTGVDQSGPSYEVRVFLDNPAADETTATTVENGYAGSFHVYGYGVWPREHEGPDDLQTEATRPPARVTRYLVATDAVRRAFAESGEPVSVTVVAVPYGAPPSALVVDLDFDSATIRLHGSSAESEGPSRPSSP